MKSRDIDGLNLAAVAPLVVVIVALGLYPQFVIKRTEDATTASIAAAKDIGEEVASR